MRILIVEDEVRFAALLAKAVRDAGLGTVVTATSLTEATQRCRAARFDLVVSDLRLPDGSGLAVLEGVRRIEPTTAIALMTAHADVDTARAALRLGALDYLVKPFRLEELLALVRRAPGAAPAPAMVDRPPGIIGDSAAMQRVYQDIARVARADATVLVLGESGTGKELVARAVHDLSPRHDGPFVEAHLAALTESLLESELFGHERGAFTGAEERRAGVFERAHGGTLFLDEIGEVPLRIQPKLLRVLQERRFYRLGGSAPLEVDVRIVCATNRDLRAEVAAGAFREDLYYRLEVFPIHLPPLRERREDIPALVQAWCARRGGTRVSEAALDLLRAHAWPGNVRELHNALERAALRADGGPLDAEHFVDHLQPRFAPRPSGVSGGDFNDVQRQAILDALHRSGGNKKAAAALLKISRRRLYSRMRALGMPLSAADLAEGEGDDDR